MKAKKSDKTPEIEVGILMAKAIRFKLKGSFRREGSEDRWQGEVEARISGEGLELRCNGEITGVGREVLFLPADGAASGVLIRDVVIGIGFHWEQKEDQLFPGALKLLVSDSLIQAINVVSVEDYLISVISSEMRGDSAPALLEAHTIISRSWLLAQIEKQESLEEKGETYEMIHHSDTAFIRWYDREDHSDFHVCADDHCQRYQGVTRARNEEVERAVNKTRGQVLVHEGKICDARFSKCCGGVVEEFEYCWEPVAHPYLKRVDDNPADRPVNVKDLKIEAHAREFINSSPDAFCNTRDAKLLKQVLNDYDQSFGDFYRWEVQIKQEELAALIRKKSGMDFGSILDLIPVDRGESGRLVRLKVQGTLKTMTVGKELEIRRWLSESHLYSSAFTVEKGAISNGIPGVFTLRGAGWGHGVGLCQIGAAVMASKGYDHQEILTHYFIDAKLEKRYE